MQVWILLCGFMWSGLMTFFQGAAVLLYFWIESFNISKEDKIDTHPVCLLESCLQCASYNMAFGGATFFFFYFLFFVVRLRNNTVQHL